MNAFHIHFPWFVVSCVLGALLFFQREFGTIHNHYTSDTTSHEVKVRVPGPVNTIYVPVPAIVDTQAILRNYFALNIYSQTVSDSSFSATIIDTIQQNKLKGRGFSYKITRKAIIQDKEKMKIFAGLNVGAGKSGFASLAPEVYVLTKKDHMYGVGYNLIDNSINVKAGWKLSFKK